jgi:hypothetical protein
MNEAQKNPVNRHFANQQKPKTKEEQIKDLLLDAKRKKDCEKQLSNLLRQFRGKKSILQLLPVIRHRYPHLIDTAIKRLDNKKESLPIEDLIYLEGFKASLTEKK